MKWIFAINAASIPSYGDYARVAVLSARAHSSLDAVCLFDGPESEFTEWMQTHGVEVIFVRSRLYGALEAAATRRNQPFWMSIGPGTSLRMQIPRLARERGWDDEYVFYTDCDVMFQADPRSWLEPLRPRFFSGAPETFMDKRLHMNAGVMWMNVRGFDNLDFDAWVDCNLERCCEWQYDQSAYRVYFNPLHRFLWEAKVPYKLPYSLMARLPHTWKWDDLPLELNWKAYWGENEVAPVIHFQGLKPTHRTESQSGEMDPFIAKMGTPYFHQCARKWDEWLAQARPS